VLSLAIFIPASGWIGDRFGTKKTFLFALGVFTLGSALCSMAPSVGLLILFRILQGVGGGMMTPVGTTMLFRAFPPNERANASALLSIPAALAPAIGPTLGGWLVDSAGWRWIFLVNIPVGVAGFLFSLRYLKELQEKTTSKFDLAGFLLSGAGLALFLYALSVVPTHGPFSPIVMLCGTAGILLLVLMVRVETKSEHPILNLGLFRERLFRTANLVMFFAFAMWLGYLFLLPIFLQQLGGFSALQTGLTLSPQAIGWLAVSSIASRLYPKLKPRLMISLGLAGATAMTAFFIFVQPDANLWLLRLVLFLRGFTMGFAVIPVQAAVFTNISSQETGKASSLFNTNRQVAASLGVAVVGTVLFELQRLGSVSDPGPYKIAFGVASLLGVIAVVLALIIKNQDAEASFTRKTIIESH
jgi:EmrB/QacA subfamily drug resistance transporter